MKNKKKTHTTGKWWLKLKSFNKSVPIRVGTMVNLYHKYAILDYLNSIKTIQS